MTSSDGLPDDALDRLSGMVGTVITGDEGGRGLRIGIAASKFNGGITWRLLEGTLAGLSESGADLSDVTVAWAPGAFELPLIARALAGTVDAVICLGAVIRGDTGHYDFVAGECAAGILRVQLDTGVPVIFGVLTTDTVAQAEERSVEGAANKGWEAAETAVAMCRVLAGIR